MWNRFGALLWVTVATAIAAGAQPPDTRIGVVHFEAVVEASPAFGEASRGWSTRLTELTAEVQALQDEFQTAEERLAQSPPPLEGDARTELVASMERLRAEIERRRADVEPELNALRQSLLRPVVEAARDAVENYARSEGFHIVIDSSSAQIGFVLAAEEIDLTEAVVAALGGALPDGPRGPQDVPEIPLLPENPPAPEVPAPGQ